MDRIHESGFKKKYCNTYNLKLVKRMKRKGCRKIGLILYLTFRSKIQPSIKTKFNNINKKKYCELYVDDEGIKKLKYMFYPKVISKEYNIAIRKKTRGKGYVVYIRLSAYNQYYYRELAIKDSLREVRSFLYDKFGIEVVL